MVRVFSVALTGIIAVSFGHSLAAQQCSADSLLTCPGSCVERCADDDDFFNQNLEQCAQLTRNFARNPDAMNPELCESENELIANELGQCLGKARSIQRELSGDSTIDALFETAPSCASNPYALTQLYNCLGSEGDNISKVYQPLTTRGYSSAVEPGDAGALPQVCGIERGQIDRDRLLADVLTEQSTALLGEFGSVSACRQDWESWLDDYSANCSSQSTVTCGSSINGIIEIMQSQIAPASEREIEIRDIVRGIEDQLVDIRSVMFSRTLICPPDE